MLCLLCYMVRISQTCLLIVRAIKHVLQPACMLCGVCMHQLKSPCSQAPECLRPASISLTVAFTTSITMQAGSGA